MSFAMALVRVTGRYESTLPAGFPGFRKGTIAEIITLEMKFFESAWKVRQHNRATEKIV